MSLARMRCSRLGPHLPPRFARLTLHGRFGYNPKRYTNEIDPTPPTDPSSIMLRILGSRNRMCDGVSRRDLLQVGGLGMLGMGLPQLLDSHAARAGDNLAGNASSSATFGRAKSCICLFLYGAWSQLDTFDMKPDAPAEIRGEFKPISSSVPGLRICEHLPRISRIMDRLTLVRSMTHAHPTHCVAYALSGIPKNPLRDTSEYWPFYASTLEYLLDRDSADRQPRGIPRNMCLPFPLNSHSTNRSHRGLVTAWLGQQYEPIFGEFDGQASREVGFPSGNGSEAVLSRYDPFDGVVPESTFRLMTTTYLEHAAKVGLSHKFAKAGIDLPADITVGRIQERRALMRRLDAFRRRLERPQGVRNLNRFQEMAYDMITSPGCATALDVTREPEAVRDKYGYTLFGQGALAARRLVEAGVRVVTLYWDEYGPANTAWDTHVNNFPRLKEGLCPTLDQVYSTLLDDLDQRGMLDDTLVLLMSEHGRTPVIGDKPGGSREHWSHAYCGIFAGAGIRQGQVIGATDAHAGYPSLRPLDPKNVLATIYHLMGFDPATTLTYDRLGRPHPLLPFGNIVPEMLT